MIQKLLFWYLLVTRVINSLRIKIVENVNKRVFFFLVKNTRVFPPNDPL